MKNFLSIVWYRVLPPVYGGQQGIARFNDELGEHVPLTCLCSSDNEAAEAVSYRVINDLPVSRLQFLLPSARKRILREITEGKFSHIIIEHPYHGWLGKYKRRLGFTFIVHAHNIEHLRMKARKKWWWRLIQKVEKNAFSAADLILFKTENDLDTAARLFHLPSSKCMIVPFGTQVTAQPAANPEAVLDSRRQHGISGNEVILLFAGTPDYEPNAAALDEILDTILPALRRRQFPFRMFICGNLPPRLQEKAKRFPDVTAPGLVPSMEPYYHAANVFLNPVRRGAGVQTKNIEAIAHGCNVVCTPFSATGMPGYLVDQKIFIADATDDIATLVIRVSANVKNVPERFFTEYSWEQIVLGLLDRLDSTGSP